MVRDRIEGDAVLVMAGNYRQAEDWARARGLQPRDWVYASAEGNLGGLHFSRYAIVGTFYQRKDWFSLRQYMRTRLDVDAQNITDQN